MVTVKHLPKEAEYQYPTAELAKAHAQQAVEQSKGKLLVKEDKDGTLIISAKRADKE